MATTSILAVYALLGVSRSMAVYQNYFAPVTVLDHFTATELPRVAVERGIAESTFEHSPSFNTRPDMEGRQNPTISLCYGGEWHRFPSSFFIPSSASISVRFVKSDFSGLLPKAFTILEAENPIWKSTRAEPSGFNDRNQEELDRYASYFLPWFFLSRARLMLFVFRSMLSLAPSSVSLNSRTTKVCGQVTHHETFRAIHS